MISAFFKWWIAQLRTLVPAGLGLSPGDAEAWIVELPDQTGAEITLWQRRLRRESRLGAYPANAEGIAVLASALPGRRPLRVILRAAPDVLLERQVVLPLAAERDWLNVLRYEMDRLTPFAADQVFWTGQIEHRDTRRGTLALRLSMIPKLSLLPFLQPLTAIGLPPAAIEFGLGQKLQIALAGTGAVPARQRDPARMLAVLCGALALVALSLPFAAQSYRAALAAHQIARLQPAVQQAETLLDNRSASAATIDVLKTARGQVGDPLAVLAAVTQALPDNTVLTELTLNHLQLNIAGQSAAAAPLLAALSGFPMLTDVVFTAPVTRDPGSHEDLFSIQAEVVPQ